MVELLAVLLTIGIIVALLLPAGKKALDQGRAARCAGNLRSIGQLCLNYATDNNRPPPNSEGTDPNDENASVHWPRILLEAMDPAITRTTASKDVSARMRRSDYAQLFWCPNYVIAYGNSTHPAGRTSYGMNSYFYKNQSSAPTMAKIAADGIASEPFIMCGMPFSQWPALNGANHIGNLDDTAPTTSSSSAAYFHGGTGDRRVGNMLFLDGHVETLTEKDALQRYQTAVKDWTNF